MILAYDIVVKCSEGRALAQWWGDLGQISDTNESDAQPFGQSCLDNEISLWYER